MTDQDLIKKFLVNNHFGQSAEESLPMITFEFEHLLKKLELANLIFDDEKSEGKEALQKTVEVMKKILEIFLNPTK